VSAGASGAIFGLLGGLLVELLLHAGRYRTAWRRAVVPSLALVTVAQVCIGFFYPRIDQAAHLAGLAGGALVAVLVSPHARWQRVGGALAAAVAVGWLAASGWAALAVIGTDYGDTLARSPRVDRALGGLAVRSPAAWEPDGDALVDRDLGVVLHLGRAGAGPVAGLLEQWMRDKPPDREATRAADVAVPLPPGWTGIEMTVVLDDELGNHHRHRLLYFGRGDAAGTALGALLVPERLARDAAPELADVIASIGAAAR